MAFDGTTIAAVRKELSDSILGRTHLQNCTAGTGRTVDHNKTPEATQTIYFCKCISSIDLYSLMRINRVL